jgi:hypothetical protein
MEIESIQPRRATFPGYVYWAIALGQFGEAHARSDV